MGWFREVQPLLRYRNDGRRTSARGKEDKRERKGREGQLEREGKGETSGDGARERERERTSKSALVTTA